jgi:hypothetical protein
MMLRPKTWLAAARAAAGYSAPLLPFASFPAALTVEGQIRRPAELPHVSLIALAGLWRPLGGRQVLASRYINPVTGQNTSEATIETIGPFPGGLVRSGMRLELNARCELSAISGSPRYFIARIGNGASLNYMAQGSSSNSGTDRHARLFSPLDVLSDTSAAHRGGYQSFQVWDSAIRTPTVDFSQAWSVDIRGISVNETATNITSASWAGGVATFVNPSHTLNTGDKTTVAGVSNTAYNGVYTGITRIDANTWSGTLVADPGGAGTGGSSSRISNVISQSYSLELLG